MLSKSLIRTIQDPQGEERMTPTILSAKQAAKEAGKATSTITTAIKSGKLSATKNENGSFEIDPAELLRAHPKKSNSKRLDPVIENPN